MSARTRRRALIYTVPVIVEVKASPDHRRGELCRKVLEIIDAHTGNFCVESFDPFIVAWFRFHAPDLLRGQLTSQRDDLGGNLGAWLSSRMLIGCIGRPQFIAHRTGKKSLGVKLAELLGAHGAKQSVIEKLRGRRKEN